MKVDEDVEMGGVKAGEDVEMGGVMIDRPNPFQQWQIQRSDQTPCPLGGEGAVSDELATASTGLFAKLPGELRNRIYRLALVEKEKPFVVRMKAGTCR